MIRAAVGVLEVAAEVGRAGCRGGYEPVSGSDGD